AAAIAARGAASAASEAPRSTPRVGLSLSRDQRDYVRREVIRRTLEEQKEIIRRSRDFNLEVAINDAVYQELDRLKGEKGGRETAAQRRFWSRVAGEFHSTDDSGRERILAGIIDMYVDEIMGYFNPVLHNLAARVIPWGLKAMLSRVSPASFLSWVGDRLDLEENLTISGPVDDIRALSEKATLIVTPTHVSNMDSVAIGIGLYSLRLPPFTYGAGLNLFQNPVVAFFMNNLGAYKVDRRKKNGIYKAALKQYAALSLEMGQHNLFFPGGTRSRGGEVEQHLKLGLLGCGLPVYIDNLRSGKPNPDIFVVPCTLSYGLVMEARTLIEDHLKETGKSRYIRVRRESTGFKALNFWRNLQRMDSRIHIRFGRPLDLFGNEVDQGGVSRDSQGRPVDRRKYVEMDGRPAHSPQRDQEYTRELGRSIQESFRRNNVALGTHVAAFALFGHIRRRYAQYDIYRLLRTEGHEHGSALPDLLAEIAALQDRLRAAEARGTLVLSPEVRAFGARELLDGALRHFRSFHDGEVMRMQGDRVYTDNMKLLYYYRNRLDHYGLDAGR
ncbi:MAG TPA: 1-acyl-sn-glycerol-3-phosphate acyltransferase, partial [Fibrobacteria bacterium]|nr:1-acyl-sn-glycerol-3-phosphate acyltransferase [Fibrobacteria bacterium]